MMKRTVLFLVAFWSLSVAFSQTYKRPSEGKSLVYFVRLSEVDVNAFKYFDGEKYLGKMRVGYFTYECDPGEHLFWAESENREFLKGELKPNATYIIQAYGKRGAISDVARFHQVSPDDRKILKKVNKRIQKKEAKLKGLNANQTGTIKSAMKKYEKLKSKNKVATLNAEWTF